MNERGNMHKLRGISLGGDPERFGQSGDLHQTDPLSQRAKNNEGKCDNFARRGKKTGDRDAFGL